MNVKNQNSLPPQAHLNRSVSGLNKTSLKPNASASSKSPGMVSKFLKMFPTFLSGYFLVLSHKLNQHHLHLALIYQLQM